MLRLADIQIGWGEEAGGCLPAFQCAAVSGRIRALVQGGNVFRRTWLAWIRFASLSFAPAGNHVIAEEQPLYGYSAQSSQMERQWEEKLRAIPSAENMRAYMKLLSAHPHHVGSKADRDNAEWILGKFKEFGL